MWNAPNTARWRKGRRAPNHERWTLARFGCSTVKWNKDGKFHETQDTPAIYHLKYNDEYNRIYSQLEVRVGFGGDKYQITLPRAKLAACLNVSVYGRTQAPKIGYPYECPKCGEVISIEDHRVVLRRIEPIRKEREKELIIYEGEIEYAKKCIREYAKIKRDIIQEKTDKQFQEGV